MLVKKIRDRHQKPNKQNSTKMSVKVFKNICYGEFQRVKKRGVDETNLSLLSLGKHASHQ